jgi:hypothetical protein
MDISIISGDVFDFDVPIFTLTGLFGQTVSYTTGQNNTQAVNNGPALDVSSTSTGFSSTFFEDLLTSLGIEDETIIDTVTTAYEEGASDLIEEIVSDDSVVAEIIAALDEMLAGFSLSGSTFDLTSGTTGTNLDTPAVLGAIDLLQEAIGTDTGLSITINSGDTFNFNVGDTEIVKLFGQTVSYVSGENNDQTVVNGSEVEVSSVATQGVAPAETSSKDSTESYGFAGSSGSSELQTTANEESSYASEGASGAPDLGFLGDGNDLQFWIENVDSPDAGADDEPTIVINSGDTFYFDVGSVEVVKMFGQTVSHVSGQINVQTVVNGRSVVSSESQGVAEGNTTIEQAAAAKTDVASTDDAETNEIVAILDQLADLLEGQDVGSSFTIDIETGDAFNFDVGNVAIVKMFRQTVSYVTGEGNVQDVTNGASGEITTGSLATEPSSVLDAPSGDFFVV